jgi:hypothetical protein
MTLLSTVTWQEKILIVQAAELPFSPNIPNIPNIRYDTPDTVA